jgi:hypothetical protein
MIKSSSTARAALSGLQTAHLIAVASSPAPTHMIDFSVRLLADKAVELGFVETISLDAVQRLLKKTVGAIAASPSR